MATYAVYFTTGGMPADGLDPSLMTFFSLVRQSDGSEPTHPTFEGPLPGGWYTYEATIPPGEVWLGVIESGGGLSNTDRYKHVRLTAADGFLDATITSRADAATTAQQATLQLVKDGVDALVAGGGTGDASQTTLLQVKTAVEALKKGPREGH